MIKPLITSKNKIGIIYSLSFIILFSMSIVFYLFTQYFGEKTGYFLGFVFYWSFWCFTVPVLFIGKKCVLELFKLNEPTFGKHSIRNLLFLILSLIAVYSYEFPKVLKQADALIIVSSIILSIVNATAEEILWRGTFLKVFGRNSKLYILYSSFGFAIWHFAPQIVFSNKEPGGTFSFVAVSFLLGLIYATIVKDTKSIFLTTISHILFDFSGLGARIYF